VTTSFALLVASTFVSASSAPGSVSWCAVRRQLHEASGGHRTSAHHASPGRMVLLRPVRDAEHVNRGLDSSQEVCYSKAMSGWEPTRHGGFRRTTGGSSESQSAAQIKQRSVPRKHHPGRVRVAWAERLGLPSCPYVIRWRIETPLGSLRVHHWLASDDDRAFHDHPWWFLTVVLKGGYTDYSPDGADYLRAGSVRFRRALHQHTVRPFSGGAWTLLVTGPQVRAWGFWKDGKFRKATKWFSMYGHHPCSSDYPVRDAS